MSGTLRAGPPRVPGGLVSAGGTTPFWQAGSRHSRLGPPPAAGGPLGGGWKSQVWWLVSVYTPLDQPVSNRRLPAAPMPSAVPPTAVAYGSLAGISTPGVSPEEKYMPTPSAAARTR